MDPGTAIALGAGVQGLGIGASIFGQSSANRANRDIAREQMDFQREMSNTAYQRGVKDMRAAGLNPLLAYGQGGASTPSGSSANMENIAGNISSSAVDLIRMKKDIEEAQSRIDLQSEQSGTERERQMNLAANTDAINVSRAKDEASLIPLKLMSQMYLKHPWLIPAEKSMEFIGPIMRGIGGPMGAFFGGRYGASSGKDVPTDYRGTDRILIPRRN